MIDYLLKNIVHVIIKIDHCQGVVFIHLAMTFVDKQSSVYFVIENKNRYEISRYVFWYTCDLY